MFPDKEEVTDIVTKNLVGKGKKLEDLQDSWFIKYLVISIREAVWTLTEAARIAYASITVKNAKGHELDDKGYDFGVDRIEATKALHKVTLRKSNVVAADTPVPDGYLLTSTAVYEKAPIKFTVVAGQNLYIEAGKQSVEVIVECELEGAVGNVANGAINLTAQSGFDSAEGSYIFKPGTDKESDDAYRERILVRKRTPVRGGVPADYERWAMEIAGVSKAKTFRIARGAGTVDVIIWGPNGEMPENGLIEACQKHIDSVTPADIADGGVVVCAPEEILIDVVLSNVDAKQGYTDEDIVSVLKSTFGDFFKSGKADEALTVVDCIVTARMAYNPNDTEQTPIINNFTLVEPKEDISFTGRQSPVLNNVEINR